MRVILIFLLSGLNFIVSAQFGFIGDVVKGGANIVKDVAQSAGNVYQQVTAPIRNITTEVYNNTLRQPVDQLKNGVNSILPDDVKNFYKYEIQNRIQPFISNYNGIITGEINVVDGTQNLIDHSVALAKETFITPEIASLYYAARAASSPVPQDFFVKIQPYWTSATNRSLHSNYAKYIVSESLVDALTALGNSEMAAITLYDVIVFREPLSMTPNSLSLLAHEMTHVAQYRDLGFAAFLATYIAENLKHGYDQSPKEVEGRSVENKIYRYLTSDPGATNSQIRLSNVSTINFNGTAVANIAFFNAAASNPNEYVSFLITKAQSLNDINEAKGIVGFILNNNRVTASNKAYCCRMMSAGPLSADLSIQDRISWAKAAASYCPADPINWFFLASIASQAQDAQTHFEALINLSGLIINEELRKFNPDYNRLYMASSYLGFAIQLGNYLSYQQSRFYDTRMPFVMLIELGVYLPLNYSKDIQMHQYAQTLANIDASINVKDELHLRVIGALTGVHLYFAIQNHNLFVNSGNTGFLFEKRNRAVAAIQHANWGLNELGLYQQQPVQMYRNLYNNLLQNAYAHNN